MHRIDIQGSAWVTPCGGFSSRARYRPWLLLAGCVGVAMVHAIPFALRPRYDVVATYFKAQLGLLLIGIVAARVIWSWRRSQSDPGWLWYLVLAVSSPIMVDCLVEGLYLIYMG
jgi:hypothetical protein